MILYPIYKWDKTLERLAKDNSKEKLIVYSDDVKLTQRDPIDNYKGFDLNALCRYETLASINVNMGNYKSIAMDYIDYFFDIFNNYDNIDKIVTWNNVLSFRKIPYIMAKKFNIETRILDYSAFRNRLVVDYNDVSLFSDFYNKYVDYYRYLNLSEDCIIELDAFISKYKEDKITRISDANCERIININDFSLVILQVQNDANILYYQNNIVNNSTILEYIKSDTTKNYLIRNHPLTENKQEIKKFFTGYGFVDDFKMHDLLDKCKEIITINSSVGIEGLCYNKPVKCLGNSIYNKVIDNKNFLWYYINKFTVKYDDINYII